MKIQMRLLRPANCLSSVLGRWSATIDGWPIPVAVEFLQAEDVDPFVERILLEPRRVLPVIVLAADGRFKATPSAMQNLQLELLGAAHVVALTSPAATSRLARLLGAGLACSEGVLDPLLSDKTANANVRELCV